MISQNSISRVPISNIRRIVDSTIDPEFDTTECQEVIVPYESTTLNIRYESTSVLVNFENSSVTPPYENTEVIIKC